MDAPNNVGKSGVGEEFLLHLDVCRRDSASGRVNWSAHTIVGGLEELFEKVKEEVRTSEGTVLRVRRVRG